ncbi:hypothetical protein GDO81_018306 [Engystomops pustulosus]|uniref:Uncharacterized protein n=1 Tax=Engystomops pustulosus TaxID=76066 RepID=A0AAV7AD89_ENGPU|nr:hypothetical protein GDO81_018306 [Engystomops pustulosus]KAG8557047.1 hypothetical protein GDO81_018306 [Engystomops pustulosus]
MDLYVDVVQDSRVHRLCSGCKSLSLGPTPGASPQRGSTRGDHLSQTTRQHFIFNGLQ